MQDDIMRQDVDSASLAIVPALIGGLLGALVGGGLWAVIAVITKYEIGWIAIGVGFLAGGGVVLLGRQRGIPFQVIAVAMAVVGLGIGKYLIFFFLGRQEIIDQFGVEAWDAVGFTLTSPEIIQGFFETLGESLQAIDLLFLGLAILTAWGIPSARAAAATADSSGESGA